MARLSQRSINNIVIFAMLFMIALFNFDVLLPKPDKTRIFSLLPQEAQILKISSNQFVVQQSSEQYVLKEGSIETNPVDLVSSWARAEVSQRGKPITQLTDSIVINVTLDNELNIHEIELFPNEPKLVKYNTQWFELINTETDQLIGKTR